MTRTTKVWIHGLLAAAVSGGASAVVGGVGVSVIDPTHFNFGAELIPTVKLMCGLFIINGLIGTFGYLKQSPVPAEAMVVEETVKTTVTATPKDGP